MREDEPTALRSLVDGAVTRRNVVKASLGLGFCAAISPAWAQMITTSAETPWLRSVSHSLLASLTARSLDQNGMVMASPTWTAQPSDSLTTLNVCIAIGATQRFRLNPPCADFSAIGGRRID